MSDMQNFVAQQRCLFDIASCQLLTCRANKLLDRNHL